VPSGFVILDRSDQARSRHQVSPLVAAADLQGAAVPPVELQEIHRLEQLVAELRVADPAAVEPRLDRVAFEHPVDGEVLADVAEELEDGHRLSPFQVANDQRAGLAVVKVEESGHLTADLLHPLGDHVAGVQHPLRRLAAGVADQPGRPAHQPDRPVTGQLEPAHGQQHDQIADMQARRGRVETAVERYRTGSQRFAQFVEVGRVGDQASPGEFVDDVHACMVPSQRGEGVTGFRLRGTWARYADTVGSPSIQYRQGRSIAVLIPTRGPWQIFLS
jgi:hypothetical protein